MARKSPPIAPLTAAITGAAVGAAAVALTDKRTCTQLKGKAKQLLKSGESELNRLKAEVKKSKTTSRRSSS